jgi:streptogramin lyase
VLGPDAAPHGVIVGPDGADWVAEGGQNAVARVDPATRAVKLFPLPKDRRNANLNTATAGGCSGSPGRMASVAGSIPNRAR